MSLVCDDPFRLGLKKKAHKSAVKAASNAYFEKCRQHLTSIDWRDDMKLCTRCRCEVSQRIKKITERQEAGRLIVAALADAIAAPPVNEPEPGAMDMPSETHGSPDQQSNEQIQESDSNSSGDRSGANQASSVAAISSNSGDQTTSREASVFPESEGGHDDVVPGTSASIIPASSVASSGVEYTDKDVAKEKFNRTSHLLGVSPLAAGISRRPGDVRRKFNRASTNLKTTLEEATGTPITEKDDSSYSSIIIASITKRYPDLETKQEKYSMLTCLPPFFTIRDMQTQLHVSEYMAKKVSTFRKKEGPFYVPEFKSTSHPITDEVLHKVREYYLSDDNSRPSPSERETLKVLDPDGVKRMHAKRYMLVNSKDSYQEFKKENPEAKIGATKFIKLKPRQCKWPGNKGFPITCACITHENFKLVVAGFKNACIEYVAKNDDDDDVDDDEQEVEEEEYDEAEKEQKDRETAVVYAVLDNTSELINFVLCNNPTEECYVGVCDKCPNLDSYDLLFKYINDDEIEFDFWETKPNTNLNQMRMPLEDFKDKFLAVLQSFWVHDYIYKQQKMFITELKLALPNNPTHAAVNVDFGENYSFVVQTAVQGFHWSNNQATIHPFVVYYTNPVDNATKYKTYFVISDDLTHDASTFHAFRTKAIEFMKNDMPHVKHLEYFSDGAGSQYKNYKNIVNLVQHRSDYGLTANWHFSATAHGKSMCDAMSAVIKRTCRLASIKDGERILTAQEMYNVVQRKLTSDTLQILFVTKPEVELARTRLLERYDNAKKIPGIRKLHCIKVRDDGMIIAQVFSNSEQHELFPVVSVDGEIPEELPEDRMQYRIGEFLAVFICKTYQIGKVVAFNENSEECTMTMMKKSGKAGVSLSWPTVERERVVSYNDILGQVNAPEISRGTGSTYRLTEDDVTMVNRNKDARINMFLRN